MKETVRVFEDNVAIDPSCKGCPGLWWDPEIGRLCCDMDCDDDKKAAN